MKTQLIAIFALLFISVAANATTAASTFDDPNNELSPMGQAYKDKKDCKGRKSSDRFQIRNDGTSTPRTVRGTNGSSNT